MGEALLPGGGETIDALGQHVGERGQVALGGRALLTALVEHLHEGAQANGDQESDDQRGDSAAERRLRHQ